MGLNSRRRSSKFGINIQFDAKADAYQPGLQRLEAQGVFVSGGSAAAQLAAICSSAWLAARS